MALTHHDSRPYAEAAANAAMGARAKMEAMIEAGRSQAVAVLAAVVNDQPHDQIVAGRALDWHPTANGVDVLIGDKPIGLHKHALGQMAQRADIPAAYVTHLMGSDWGRETLAHNLRRGYRDGRPGARFLAREVNGEIRGFLSDKFRRMDSRPIFETFASVAMGLGAVPYGGHALATKHEIKAIMPIIYEPIANEPMLVGMQLLNSDFGDGALSLRLFVHRLWCTNNATMDESMRQVHLGRRLDDGIAYSDRTYRLDTEATVSALSDTVKGLLGPEGIEKTVDRVRRANEAKIDPTKARDLLKGLTKAEQEAVIETYTSADVVAVPAGQTAWRLSNALSWVAGGVADKARTLEMERLAGDLLIRATGGAPEASPTAN